MEEKQIPINIAEEESFNIHVNRTKNLMFS